MSTVNTCHNSSELLKESVTNDVEVGSQPCHLMTPRRWIARHGRTCEGGGSAVNRHTWLAVDSDTQHNATWMMQGRRVPTLSHTHRHTRTKVVAQATSNKQAIFEMTRHSKLYSSAPIRVVSRRCTDTSLSSSLHLSNNHTLFQPFQTLTKETENVLQQQHCKHRR